MSTTVLVQFSIHFVNLCAPEPKSALLTICNGPSVLGLLKASCRREAKAGIFLTAAALQWACT